MLALTILVIGGVDDVGREESSLPGNAAVVLRNATSFQLLSLDPASGDEGPTDKGFHGWTILDSVAITDAARRDELIDALEIGVAENDGEAAGCFDPRHGIRVMYEGIQHDFVICFECYQARWYTEGRRNAGFLLTNSPQPTFDAALRHGFFAQLLEFAPFLFLLVITLFVLWWSARHCRARPGPIQKE